MTFGGFLAQAAVNPQVLDLPQSARTVAGMHIRDLIFILTLSVTLLTALVVWAIFIRKPKNEHARTRVYKSRSDAEELDDGTIRKRKRMKRQRRAHRTRNPTLSEAGGLPPMRPDGSPPPI